MRFILIALTLNLALIAQEPAKVKGEDAYFVVRYQDQEHPIYVGPTTRVGYDQKANGIAATIYAGTEFAVSLKFPGKELGSFKFGKDTSLNFADEGLKGSLLDGNLTITVLEKTALQGHFKGTIKTESGTHPIEGRFLLPAYIR